MGEEIIQSAPAPAAVHLPLVSVNHVSFLCRSVEESSKFYQEVLGFTLVKRPSSFDFKGAWLSKYGIGIHLLELDNPDNAPTKKSKINPKDNHISFQCSDMSLLVATLKDMKIDYVTATVEDSGITVNQVFFHDPDSYMIEICNCNNLPMLPLTSAASDGDFSRLKRLDSKGRKNKNTQQISSKRNFPDAFKGWQASTKWLKYRMESCTRLQN